MSITKITINGGQLKNTTNGIKIIINIICIAPVIALLSEYFDIFAATIQKLLMNLNEITRLT